ncbi:hypothetical protein [Fictibacillus terranigra]|uniref:Uncharacterized protein n=1 Tax=Fictibacillus terranigra TaxID=3058424 RepID=A0ABT8EAS7_9BACL|nr:hypothetical protein [Fictibacillus sp. CENA-BCM004]MDN4075008.1 hypothetical protein [Fictibacillus sp. CENA-BCM004]
MIFTTGVSIAIGLVVISSLAAWYNTQKISRDLADIKEKLEISDIEVNKSSFFDRD